MIPKIGKLIALLGSSVDAEALAARDSIARALAREGLDFNDLAYELEHHDGPGDQPTYRDGRADGHAAGYADGVAATLGKLERARLQAWRVGLAEGRREYKAELEALRRQEQSPRNIDYELERLRAEHGLRPALNQSFDFLMMTMFWIRSTCGTPYAHRISAELHALLEVTREQSAHDDRVQERKAMAELKSPEIPLPVARRLRRKQEEETWQWPR
jgi:hypothetical protein